MFRFPSQCILSPIVPVKSPDNTEVYYKKNLCDIVKACGASLILSNQHLFQGQDEFSTSSLAKLMDATAVDWFCVSSQQLFEEREVLEEPTAGDVEASTISGIEATTTTGGGEAAVAAAGVVEAAGGEKATEGVETVLPGEQAAAAKLPELDIAKPVDVAFMQFTTTGTYVWVG